MLGVRFRARFCPRPPPWGHALSGPFPGPLFVRFWSKKAPKMDPKWSPGSTRDEPKKAPELRHQNGPKRVHPVPKWTPKWLPNWPIAHPRGPPETPEDPPRPYEARPWGACWPKLRRWVGLKLPGDRFWSSRARSHPFLVLRGLFRDRKSDKNQRKHGKASKTTKQY